MATRSLTPLLIAAAFAGCATVATPDDQAVPVPADRLVAGPGQGDATVVVTRDTGFFGQGCYYALFVNTVLVARMAVGETASFRVPSGEVLLAVARDPQGQGLCHSGVHPARTQRETILRPGQKKFFRLALNEGGMDIMRAD